MGFQKDVESIIANVKKPGEKSRNAAQQSLESTNQYDGDDTDGFDEDDERALMVIRQAGGEFLMVDEL